MKTITLKADKQFDAELTGLARRLGTTKSAVIREAVGEYRTKLDREAMRERLKEVSLRLRAQNQEEMDLWEATLADGLDDEPDQR